MDRAHSFFSSFPLAFLSLSQSSYFWPLGMVESSKILACSSSCSLVRPLVSGTEDAQVDSERP
jgi:hypothetical protein